MRPLSDWHTFGVLLVVTLVILGMLGALAPTTDAGVLVRRTAATRTNRDADKKIFARCPQGWTATGGGAQAFAAEYANPDDPQGGIRNASGIVIFQMIPSQDLDGYGARARAVDGYPYAWHLTAYVICARFPQATQPQAPGLPRGR